MESRTRIDMTRWEFAWTALSILGLGVLAGWALFGKHRLIERAFDSGNAAEWVAAIGTWVIGAGAWRYARDGHLLRKRQMEESARDEVRLKATRLDAMILKAIKGTRPLAALNIVYEKDPADRLEGMVDIALQSGLEELKTLEWSDTERAILERPIAQQIAVMEIQKTTWTQYVAYGTVTWNPRSAAVLTSDKNDALKYYIKLARSLDSESRKLLELLNKARNALDVT